MGMPNSVQIISLPKKSSMLTEKPRKFFFEENEEKKLYEKIKV
jgi:hypothetical protein